MERVHVHYLRELSARERRILGAGQKGTVAMNGRLAVVIIVASLALPGIAEAQTTASDSCDVRFESGTCVVASNHGGSDAAEAVI